MTTLGISVILLAIANILNTIQIRRLSNKLEDIKKTKN